MTRLRESQSDMAENHPLPHNLEAERSVLGAILIRNDAYVVAAALLTEDGDWFRDHHRDIWRAMRRLHGRGQTIDLVPVCAELSDLGKLKAVGGQAYVSSLTDGVPRSTNVEHYASIVGMNACRRALLLQSKRASPETLAALTERLAALQAGAQTYEPLPYSDADWSATPEPRQWLVDDLLPAGRLALLTGAGESGKSRLLVQIAAGVAYDGDKPMLPMVSGAAADATQAVAQHRGAPDEAPHVRRHGRAIIVTWEDETNEFQRRIHQAAAASAVPPLETWIERFHVVNMRAIGGPIWGPRPGSYGAVGAWTEAGHRLLALLERDRPALLALDPTAAAYGCNEIDRAQVRAFCSALDGAAERYGTTIVLCHHPPKTESSYSGSTDWRNACRALLTLGKTPTGYVRSYHEKIIIAPALTREKSNYGRPVEPLWLVDHWSEPDKDHHFGQLAWFAAGSAERAALIASGEDDVLLESNNDGKKNPFRLNG